MSTPTLGTLTEAGLREAWIDEARNFTPWLADNLDALESAIGMRLELQGQEVAVDTYAADILARDPQTGDLVLIENQLESTDHTHLGQVMTYLAGLEAKIVIWIAADFREPHLSAIRWLNEHTVTPYAFFAIKIKVVKIGDSPLAPVFEVAARPNEWERHLQETIHATTNQSELNQFRRDFWTYYLTRHPSEKADGQLGVHSNRYRSFSQPDIFVSYYIAAREVGLFVRGPWGARSEDVFDMLQPYSDQIDALINCELKPNPGGHFYGQVLPNDTHDRNNWDECADWLHGKLSLYTQALVELETNNAP